MCELRDFEISNTPCNDSNKLLDDLKNIKSRSKAMISCYPGGLSHYSKHCDNAIRNGRKLTSILYLNNWSSDDGGELVIYPPILQGDDINLIARSETVIPPILNRLVLFWSDTRCPHEV